MTERKPPGVSWQTWIDRQIEQAQARGDFDGLAGTGRPLPGVDRPHDELWWVRDKLKREKVEHLPPTLAILRDRDEAVRRALAAPTDHDARVILDEMNERIRYENAHVVIGPPSTAVPVDVDAVVARRPPPPADEATPSPESEQVPPRRRLRVRPFWRR